MSGLVDAVEMYAVEDDVSSPNYMVMVVRRRHPRRVHCQTGITRELVNPGIVNLQLPSYWHPRVLRLGEDYS